MADLESLIAANDRALRRLAVRLLGDRDVMDDVLQDAYVKAHRGFARFRGESAAATWLYRVVYNTCVDELRRRRPSEQLPADAEAVGPDPDLRLDLAAALATLSVEERAAVLLVDAEEFDYATASRILGVPSGTLASRLNRARRDARAAKDGSYRLDAPDFKLAYDAAGERATSVSLTAQRRSYASWRDVDPGEFSFALNQNRFAVSLHALLDLRGARVSEVMYQGRPAWRVERRQTVGEAAFYLYGPRAVFVVDRATGFVVYAARYLTSATSPTNSVRLDHLRIDGPTPRSEFRLARPARTEVRRASWGFAPVSQAAIRSPVGYRPLLPADTKGLPRLALAAARRSSVPALRFTPAQSARAVVSAVYGNGFAAALVLTTRRYARSEGLPPRSELSVYQIAIPKRMTLTGGALAGTTAWVSASPLQNTYLWAAKGRLLIKLVSTLPEQDVIDVANSLVRG